MAMIFDSNAMAELAHLKADRYARNGGGGGFAVYNTSKAYYDSIGFSQRSKFSQARHIARLAFKDACETARADYDFAVRQWAYVLHGDRSGFIDEPFAWPLPTQAVGKVAYNVADTF
jgi:hypothetical protein